MTKTRRLEMLDVGEVDGALAITFRSGVERAVWTIPFDRTPAMIQAFAEVMDARLGSALLETEELLLAPSVDAPLLTVKAKGWPLLTLRLTWTQLRAIAQSAWGLVANAPPDHPT